MNRTHRLIAASVGALVLVGVAATPAMAAPSIGTLTVAPATGQFQFGAGNPADPFNITPSGSCPEGSEYYLDAITLQGLEDSVLETGGPLADPIFRNSRDDILTVPQHPAKFTDPTVETIFRTILPEGTTDAALSPADAAKPVGTKIAEAEFSIFSICFDANDAVKGQSEITTVTISAATRPPKPDGWDPNKFYCVLQWSWSFGPTSGEPADTTVALTASPATSAPAGTTVNLAATIAPSAATGTVEFFDGTTSLGSKPVTAGAASLSTDGLSVGSHALKAVFTPADTAAYNGSTGNLSYQITEQGGGGGQSGTVTLQTTVPTSGTEALTLTVLQTGAVSLPEAVRDGNNFVTGQNAVDLVTVTDTRSGNKPGWNVNGKVSDTFVGSNASNTFSGTALGWTPRIVQQSPGQGATAGSIVAPGTPPGLTGTGATLASAPAGSGVGTAKLGADIALQFPATTPADTYHATVTITAI